MIYISIDENHNKGQNEPEEHISIGDLLRFYIPMALTCILMSGTHTIFNMGMDRLPDTEIYQAAFAEGKGMMQILQTPSIMARQVVAALSKDQASYNQVKKYMRFTGLATMIIFATVAFSPISRWIFGVVMGLEGRILEQSIIVLRVLTPFPMAMLVRNFYQGITIRFRMTKLMTYGTALRFLFVLICYFNVRALFNLFGGGATPAAMLLGGGILEAIIITVGVFFVIGNIGKRFNYAGTLAIGENEAKSTLTLKKFMLFYLPLIATSLLKTMVGPIINGVLPRLADAAVAVSAFAVAQALANLIISPSIMYHQVPMMFDDDKPGIGRPVKQLTYGIIIVLTVIIFVVGYTPFGLIILNSLTTETISPLTQQVFKIYLLLPVLVVTRQFLWGKCLRYSAINHLLLGRGICVIALIIALTIGVLINPPNTALIGGAGILASEAAETVYLYFILKRKKSVMYGRDVSIH